MCRSHTGGIFNGKALVARQGHIVYAQALGYADAALHTPQTLEYRVNVGSRTKECRGQNSVWHHKELR